MTAHWGIVDPAAVEGAEFEKQRAFSDAARYRKNRITAFLNLPLESIKSRIEQNLNMLQKRTRILRPNSYNPFSSGDRRFEIRPMRLG